MNSIKPKLKLFDKQDIENIIFQAITILETFGITVENEEALQLFENLGISPNEKNKIFLPKDIIERSITTSPKKIDLYDRVGENPIHIGDNNVHFDPGSSALNIFDIDIGTSRKAMIKDYIEYCKVVEQLDYIDAQSTAFVCSDVSSDQADSYRLYLSLIHSKKPIITGTFKKESFSIMKDLLIAVRGDEKKLRDKPLAIFDACPSPPLKWSDLTCQSIIDSAKYGIPTGLISMPLLGASAPANIYGAIIQHTAETLSGIVISQLASEGTPVIWGGAPSLFDMRTGTTPIGAIETTLIDVGYSEVGKFLNFPTHTYMNLSDSKTIDAQAGLESGIGGILGALAGVNMISGPGMLEFVNCFSTEKLIIDNEICGMAKRFIKGISEYPEYPTIKILEEYDKTQQLLSHKSTRKVYKKEFYFPSPIIDRNTRDVWNEHKKSAFNKATDVKNKMLNSNEIIDIDKETKVLMNKIMNIL